MDIEPAVSPTGPEYKPAPKKSDKLIANLMDGEVLLAVGVPQGRNIVEDQPETAGILLVRRGGEFVELDVVSYTVWADTLIPCPRAELAGNARERWPDADVEAILRMLEGNGTLAAFDSLPSWEAWTRRLRVLPLAIGVGNSPGDVTKYSVQQSGSDVVLTFDAFSYWNWLFWDGTATIFDAAMDVASQLGAPAEIVLQRARGTVLACLNAGFAYVDSVQPVADQNRASK